MEMDSLAEDQMLVGRFFLYPANIETNIRNLLVRYSKLFCELFLCKNTQNISISNFVCLHFGYFCASVFFSKGLSFLFLHVAGVLSGSSGKQMIRIHARRIVAFVTDEASFFYFSVMKFIKNPVCSKIHIINSDLSISIFIPCSIPDPTRIRFVNLLPKFIHEIINVTDGAS